ncbi:MAG: transporter substrate-binding domain-containing protein, partial [Bdellovibrio sp.]|nr:transporter substrate-binding domain-containing protein [Bdellovibrio sp.]
MRSLIVSILVLCAGHVFAQSKVPIKVAGHELPPFFYKVDRGLNGACLDLMKRLCTEEKLQCEYSSDSVTAIPEKLRSGELAMGCPFRKTPEREKDFYVSEPLFKTAFGFAGLPKNIDKVKSEKDFAGLEIGATGSFTSSAALSRINDQLETKFSIIPELDVYGPLEKVSQENYLFAYVNKDTMVFWNKNHQTKLEMVPALGEQFQYHILFSKKVFSAKEFAQLNA